jgi:hypothetical protein
MQRKPLAWDDAKYGTQQLWSNQRAGQSSGIALDHLDKVGAGKEIGVSAQEMARLTAGQRARLTATNQGQKAAATERAIATGNAGRGGMLEASMTTLDDALLGQQRGLEADSTNFALQQRASDRDRAVSANQIALNANLTQRNQNAELAKLRYGIDSARQQFGSPLERFLQGSIGGFMGGRG